MNCSDVSRDQLLLQPPCLYASLANPTWLFCWSKLQEAIVSTSRIGNREEDSHSVAERDKGEGGRKLSSATSGESSKRRLTPSGGTRLQRPRSSFRCPWQRSRPCTCWIPATTVPNSSLQGTSSVLSRRRGERDSHALGIVYCVELKKENETTSELRVSQGTL